MSNKVMSDGSPIVSEEYKQIDPKTGMQSGYVVLSEEERAKGFVRPVRHTYKHLTCKTETTMARVLAETYAREPKFYGGTYCCGCRAHYPVSEFLWADSDEVVGS